MPNNPFNPIARKTRSGLTATLGAMRYSPTAHLVNAAFLVGIFVLPISYCLTHPSIPIDVGRTVILLSFLLGAFAITDWYHLYLSNSFGGIALTLGFGISLAAAALVIGALVSGGSVYALATFEQSDLWPVPRLLARSYIAGIAVAAVAALSIPRLLAIRAMSGSERLIEMAPNKSYMDSPRK